MNIYVLDAYICSYDLHSGGLKLLQTAQIKKSGLLSVTLKMVKSGQKCENFLYTLLHILHEFLQRQSIKSPQVLSRLTVTYLLGMVGYSVLVLNPLECQTHDLPLLSCLAQGGLKCHCFL